MIYCLKIYGCSAGIQRCIDQLGSCVNDNAFGYSIESHLVLPLPRGKKLDGHKQILIQEGGVSIPGLLDHRLEAVEYGIMSKKINWVLDLDIKKFFDTVEHAWLIRILEHRIVDKRVLRLITQWITVGYQDAKGRRCRATVGMPQGSLCRSQTNE